MTRPWRPYSARLRSRLSEQDGAAATEFALVLPVLSLMLFSIIQFGVTLNAYIELCNGAAAGARQLAISRGQSNPWSSTKLAVNNAATNLSMATKGTYRIVVNGVTCTSDNAVCQNAFGQGGNAASVTVTYPCNLTFLKIKIPGCTLSSTATEIIQ